MWLRGRETSQAHLFLRPFAGVKQVLPCVVTPEADTSAWLS